MNPLIITVTIANSWLHPEAKYPKTAPEMAEAAKKCEREGASIVHIHATGFWKEAIDSIRRSSNVIVQSGMSSLSIEERMEVFKAKSDMLSVILGHHDEAFINESTYKLHTREELSQYLTLCSQYNVKPEFEVWSTGHIWNLNYLIQKGLLAKPYFTTLFFGWPGGAWSPPTAEEYYYRRKYMPEGSIVNVSVMGKEQNKILIQSILEGDHIRVGTEDNPYIGDELAEDAGQIVGHFADLARSLGRKVATVNEAREILSQVSVKNE